MLGLKLTHVIKKTMPLAGPMLSYYQLGPREQTSVKFELKLRSKKIHFEMSSAKWQPFCLGLNVLTHWGRVTHIYVSKVGHHWLSWWAAPSHHLNRCRNIVNWTLENKLQWNLNRHLYILIQENAFEIVVRELAAILSRPQCVKSCSLRGAISTES